MSSPTFAFKQFNIKQDKCAMKVNTDGVLLGAWANVDRANFILDIGTGTGVIALMLAQRNQTATIDAIEVDEQSYQQAYDNIQRSPWEERIKIYHDLFQRFAQHCKQKYDLIVSNPPYFIDSSKALEEARTQARHADNLPYEELIEGVCKILDKKGRFCVILPVKEADILRELAEEKGLQLSHILRIKTTADKIEKRLLMEFEYSPTGFSENTLVIEKDERHSFSEEYKQLTKDFYLNF